ncbi:MAG: branched-chain amino acid transaminase [Nitrososphaeraceae archaeon]
MQNNEGNLIWMNGYFVPWHKAQIHVMTHALHYGTAIFEGIRCYNTPTGLAIFRLRDHIERLLNSGKIYFMKIKYSRQELEEAVIESIKKNKINECYVRPIAYFDYGKMGINPLNNSVSIAISVWNWDEYLNSNKSNLGIKVMISGWIRLDKRSMPLHAKATANYANSALARMEAIKAGFDEAIMLNSDGNIIEASGENIFIIKDNILITPPTSSGALKGITRDTILTLANQYDIKSEIRDISKDELYLSDEVFLSGTAAEIKSVREIDNRTIGDEKKTYPVTNKLKNLFNDLVMGKNKNYSRKWLKYIDKT